MKKILLISSVLAFCIFSSLSFAQLATHVVIAEVYNGGGSSGATYRNDYVVLYNPTGSSVSLSGWSLQRELGTVPGWSQKVKLTGSIASNTYYMIQGASAGSNGVPLPVVPSASGSAFNLQAAGGEVALVNDTTTITGIGDITVVDFVGYGTATSSEGSSPVVPALTTTQSMRRKDNSGANTYGTNGSGWDSNFNSADFYIESNLIANPPKGQSFFSAHVVIAEIYGGGGNSNPDAPYLYDYIVLYNPTGSAIDVSNWSLQYKAAATTTGSWSSVNLSGSISPLSYYMIQLGGTTGGPGVTLPVIPNVIGSYTISASTGKVALVKNPTILSGDPTLPDINIADFIGYGTSASIFEGGSRAPAPSNTSSIRRRDNSGGATYGTNGSGTDSDNNGADFYVETNILVNAPLPVELSSFSVSVIGSNVKLSWRTETEVNNYGFEVERYALSAERQAWEKIGFVNGNGNSNSPKDYSFLDESVTNYSYSYRLKQIDNDGQFEYSKTIEVVLGTPRKFELSQNYPNPFNPATTIKFTLPEAGNVKLTLFNILGQEVKTLVNGFKESGVHTVDFNASELNSGIYIYKIEAGSFVQTRKMTLLK